MSIVNYELAKGMGITEPWHTAMNTQLV